MHIADDDDIYIVLYNVITIAYLTVTKMDSYNKFIY